MAKREERRKTITFYLVSVCPPTALPVASITLIEPSVINLLPKNVAQKLHTSTWLMEDEADVSSSPLPRLPWLHVISSSFYCIHQHHKASVQTAWQCRNRTAQTSRTFRVLYGVLSSDSDAARTKRNYQKYSSADRQFVL